MKDVKYQLLIIKFGALREAARFDSMDELTDYYNKNWKAIVENDLTSYSMKVESK